MLKLMRACLWVDDLSQLWINRKIIEEKVVEEPKKKNGKKGNRSVTKAL